MAHPSMIFQVKSIFMFNTYACFAVRCEGNLDDKQGILNEMNAFDQ